MPEKPDTFLGILEAFDQYVEVFEPKHSGG